MALQNVMFDGPYGRVEGMVDPAFRGVAEAFVDNFVSRNEVGASCAIEHDGRLVVDIWGGRKTPDGDPWARDTISVVLSTTKGISAVCAHLAVERGLLDLDASVAQYWPEFATNGKENAVVSMMFDHSVGLPHLRARVRDGGYCDHTYMVDLVAREAPFWEPGSRHGYHGHTYAWLVGELVRRATGKSLGSYLREELTDPLGADFWIGLPEEQEHRIAPLIYSTAPSFGPDARATRMMADPDSVLNLMVNNRGGFDVNQRASRAAEVGSMAGVGNARAVARIYGAVLDPVFFSADTVARMGRVSSASHIDATMQIPTRFASGFMKSMDNRALPETIDASMILSDAAFGHVGHGGSLGFVDPAEKLAFGYTMNRMGGALLNDRGQAIVDAAYCAIGYRTNASGAWRR